MPNKGNVCHNCKGKLEGDYAESYERQKLTYGENHIMRIYCKDKKCDEIASKDISELTRIKKKKLGKVKDVKKTNLQIQGTQKAEES